MKSTVSISILSLLLSKSSYANTYGNGGMDNCESDDPLACFNTGICRNGKKPYDDLLGSVATLTPKSKRNMYCECPDDTKIKNKGHSGLHCDTQFVRCEDDSICFNGGYCERDSHSDEYHCACITSKGFAGKSCESRPTTVDGTCGTSDSFYKLTGFPWFCVNKGKCVLNET